MLKSVVGPVLRPIVRSIFDGFGSRPSPSLSLNFVTSTSLDPRITFSRTTNATVTGSNGLIQNAPMNLLTFSEQFDNAVWIKSNATVAANATAAPDGTLTADAIVEDATANAVHRVNVNNISVTSGSTYAFSVYAKKNAVDFLALSGGTAFFGSNIVTFNVATGVVVSQTGATGFITSVGNGWYRCTSIITAISTGGTQLFYNPSDNSSSASYTGVNGRTSIFIWGAQLNLGSTATTYNPTTVKNLLGFTENFDNAAWTKSNAFVQTNLLLQSEAFDNAVWNLSASNASVSANTTVAPDGTTTADTVTFASSSGYLYQAILNYPAVTGESVTFSIYSRTATKIIVFGGASPAGTDVYVSTNVGGGWFRQTLTRTFTVTTSASALRLSSTAGGADVYLWGAQLVQGTSAGDYKATYAAAAAVGYTDIYGQPFAQKLVENTANTFHGVNVLSTLIAGTPYTQSVYAKAGERSWLAMTEGNNVTASAWFNLANGTLGTVSGTGSPSASIVDMGNGWYRCSLRFTPISAAGNTQARVATANGVNSYTGDGTSGIYIFGAQLSDSASVDPYVYNPVAAPTSTAYYGPRFDYDPVTLAPKGLLIEEQRTNLFTFSEDFTNAAWTKGQITVTANSSVSPDGVADADTIAANSTVPEAYIRFTTTQATSTAHTVSVYGKKGTVNFLRLRNLAVSGAPSAWFNLNTGAVATVNSGLSATITPVGNGWYRCTITGTALGVIVNNLVDIAPATADNSASVNNGDSVIVYGAQLEAGAFATSYIPTVASQVTRAADNASMIGNNFARWYNQTEGSVYIENNYNFGSDLNSGSRIALQIDNGSASDRFILSNGGFANTFVAQVGGVTQASFNGATNTANFVKTAFGYATNSMAVSNSGSVPSTDTSCSVPIVNTMRIGMFSNGALQISGNIKRIAYYPRRLANTELQGITS